ncbi:MAG TPA: methylmalonyl-CoA mutase family protein [Acidobacteriota bacterium]
MYSKAALDDIAAQRERWEREALQQGQPQLRKAPFTTPSNLELKPIYTPLDLAGHDYSSALGFPGAEPFTRGIYPAQYLARFWTMRQYAGYGTARESNQRYRYLIAGGTTGLSVAFDLPTQLGMDSDHAQARGEVGRLGVAIDSLEDMELLFDAIPLDQVSTSMTINAPASILLALYVAVARRRGVSDARIAGTVQNDILKEYVARGTYIYPPQPSLRLASDVILYCTERLPRFNPISVSGYHMREAGCTAVQEVAFTLAHALAYVEATRARGGAVERFLPRLSFFFNSHNHLLEEVAKFRAARRLWARLVAERYRLSDPDAQRLRFHAQTAGSTLTAQQPENNVVRVAIQALAAVLGGAQSIHTNGRDEALALPTEASAKIALRTQQLLAYESGVADVIDPLGGAFAIEALTDTIEAQARAYLGEIERRGGVLACHEDGYIGREIQRAAYRAQKEIDSGERVVVGVNRFVEEGAAVPEILRIDPRSESEQVERLQALRRRRDGAAAAAALERVREVAGGAENLLPALIAAVESGATVGEVAGALREVFGEHRAGAAL